MAGWRDFIPGIMGCASALADEMRAAILYRYNSARNEFSVSLRESVMALLNRYAFCRLIAFYPKGAPSKLPSP